MALISCSECGQQVSDKATARPNCGCPVFDDKNVQAQTAGDQHGTLKEDDTPLQATPLPLSISAIPATPQPIEAQRFHVSDNSNNLGALSIDEINSGLENKTISLNATILDSSSNSWIPVTQFQDVKIPVYHVARGNEKFGPFTLLEVATNYNSGSLLDDDYILDPKTNSWHSIGEWDGVGTTYYIQHNLGEIQGPYSIATIKKGLQDGSIDASDFIKKTDSDWMPMSSNPRLKDICKTILKKRRKEQLENSGESSLEAVFWVLVLIGVVATFVVFGLVISKEEVGSSLWNIFAVITWLIIYVRVIRWFTNELIRLFSKKKS